MAEKQQQKRQQKQQDKQVDDKKPKSKSRTVKKADSQDKKGGAFVNDVKNLAVPFAILLAKEGLTKYFKDEKAPEKKASTAAKNSSKSASSSMTRRRTMAGGSCNLGCGALTGGAAAKQLFALQEQIDNFLEKY